MMSDLFNSYTPYDHKVFCISSSDINLCGFICVVASLQWRYDKVSVLAHDAEVVSSFVHLGSCISADRGSKSDLTCLCMRAVNCNTWCSTVKVQLISATHCSIDGLQSACCCRHDCLESVVCLLCHVQFVPAAQWEGWHCSEISSFFAHYKYQASSMWTSTMCFQVLFRRMARYMGLLRGK